MSALRKLQKGMSKGALQTTRLARKTGGLVKDGAGIVKDGTMGIINDAKEGIKEGLQDEKSRELKRSNSGHFHESDDEKGSDLRMSLAIPSNPSNANKQNFIAGYSIRPGVDDANGADSDDELYLDAVPESHEGEVGLNDGDDDSTGAQVRKKKKKVRKIKYRKDGEDSDGSADAKSAKSSKSSKSGKSRKKKNRAGRSDLSVGSRRKKKVDRDASPTRHMSSQSVQSETSSKKKKKKKPIQAFDSSDDDDEKNDMLSPLSEKKKPVLPTRSRSKSPSRSPSTRSKTFEDKTPPLSPAVSSDAREEQPFKQELTRFSDIWKTQAEEEERESIKVSKISAIMGQLNGEVKEEIKEAADPYDNDFLDAKLRSTEQKLLDSEAKVEELIVKKSDIQKELNEEQLRNDELGRKLLYLEDKVEELENEKAELESAPKVVEQQADPIEVFELQQEVNQLKTDMSIQMDQHSEALFAKDERIKELEAKLEAGGGADGVQESMTSIQSTVSHTSDARTRGLLLRSQDKIAKQEEEITELKQKLQELGNADIIAQKDEEITNLGVQMSELETKMKEMEQKHQKALKEKEETINFFQTQLVEMQKKMPKPAAYTAREKVGTEGTMSLGGEGESEERGNGLWGAISSASPGWLGGRQTMDRRRTREGVENAPNL